MAIQNPQELFYYDLCAMYDGEQKLALLLPLLAQEAQIPEVKEAFSEHHQQTLLHIVNLERCFQIAGKQQMPLENHTFAGLRKDHDVFLEQQPSQAELMMFALNAAYKSEFLEMAAYNSLIDAATCLGMRDCLPLLQENLQQEQETAKKLAVLIHKFALLTVK
ncbi:DUF892 family protein [Ktedonosporobacter rubrisoli]|uniref:DUF892 family protein n=1 Tax=Ktedonosporobacter rubrisoli TaxID=2509675 RepID=A0A4P6JS45_KTERU|nr:DUF892 family protein [Ktedonosporobacter rubrisoli]QBD78329.1 DUF892 family protein [Ktedonosporobacter rubrisoli]